MEALGKGTLCTPGLRVPIDPFHTFCVLDRMAATGSGLYFPSRTGPLLLPSSHPTHMIKDHQHS